MTNSLHGVPFNARELYDVRRGRRPLFGMYPTVAFKLAGHGAKLSDILAPLHATEREIMRSYSMTINMSLSDLNVQETEANCRFDKAQLALAENPKSVAAFDEAIDACTDQRIASDLYIAKLEQIREGL